MNNSNIMNIKKIASKFYTAEEILEAKKFLWKISGPDLKKYTERRNTEQRSCVEANMNDIIDALTELDAKSKLPLFVARNVEKIPDRQPEEINLLSIINRVNKLENMMNDYTCTINSLNMDTDLCKSRIKEHELQLHKNDEVFKSVYEEMNKLKVGFDNFTINTANEERSCNKINGKTEFLTNKNVSPEGETIDSHAENSNNDEVLHDEISDSNLIDDDLLQRFNRLRYLENTPETKNNSLSLEDFEKFLDSFDENKRMSASLNEFMDKQLNSNDLLCNKIKIDSRKYSQVAKEPAAMVLQKNEKSPKNNVKIKLIDNSYHSPEKIIDNEGFQLYESRSTWNKRKQLFKEQFNLKGAPASDVDIWVYRVTEGNCEDVLSYLKSKNVECRNIERKSHSDAKFNSFKVSVCKSELDLVLSKSFWPFNVRCKVWKNRESKNVRSVSFIGTKFRNNDTRKMLA